MPTHTIDRVPTLIHDVVANSSLELFPLENITYGGAPTPEALLERTKQAFPAAELWVHPSLYHSSNVLYAVLKHTVSPRPIR